MPPVLQKTIREIHQRLRALETREYAEVVGPGSVINAQYLTLALHAVLTAERRFVDGDGLVGVDGGANADYTLNARHALLSTSHTDTLAAAVVDGDVIIGNVTPRWSRLAIAIPAPNVRNVLGIDNAELRPSWKTALDAANPADIAGAAAPGVSLIFSHRDHVHSHPALGANLHHNEIHVVNSTGPHAEAGLTIGHVLRVSGAAAFSFAALQAGDIPGLGGVPALTLGVINAAGAAATYVQTDASVAVFDAVNPGTIQCDDAAAPGVIAFAARRDHQHAIVCAVAVNIANANAEGGSTDFSRADHVHNHPAALGANLHHTQIHDVVGGDHTLTGAQWNLVGATALNTIGLLLASSNPGAAAAILMSTAAGDLTLHDLTATGQLSAGAGIAEGLILGADAQWYRSAANMLRTPDSVTIDVGLNIGTGTGAAAGSIASAGTTLTIDLDSAGDALLILDRGANTDASEVQFATAGVGGFFVGMTYAPGPPLDYFFIGQTTGGTNSSILIDTNDNVTIGNGGLNVGTGTGAVAGEGVFSGKVAVGRNTIGAQQFRVDGTAVLFADGTRLNADDLLRLANGQGGAALHTVDLRFSPGGNIVAAGPGIVAGKETATTWAAAADRDSYLAFETTLNGAEIERVRITSVGDTIPGGNKTQDLGIGGTAWDDCWADDFHNEPDLYHMDSRKNRAGQIASVDDLAVLRAIKPSGEYDARTGLPLIDDASLPEWVFTRDKNTGETLYYPDGKPCGISMKMVTGLSWGAIRQLDGYKLTADAELEALKEQIGIMQNRLAVLEAAQRRQ